MSQRIIVGALLWFAVVGSVPGSDITSLAMRYLVASGEEKEQLSNDIRNYSGSIDSVISQLQAAMPKSHRASSGTYFDERFSAPGLRDTYSDDRINFLVPNGYSPQKPFGLLIFMHGGGPGTKREYARSVISDPAEDRYSYGLRRHFTNTQFIVVAPSAPWNEKSSARWNLPEADAYIDAVVRECGYRFNIDPNRVFLGGQSMGGFGAYHLCQRLADRLAGGVLYAGAWRSARWENMHGTPLFIRHGIHDAQPADESGKGGRPRFTDVFYARAASQLLTVAGVEHVYFEDDGGHSIKAAGESLEKLVNWMRNQRRDPFPRRIVAQTPRGWNGTRDTPTPHHHWITIQDIGERTLPFDEIRRTGPGPQWKEPREAFEKQGFKLIQRQGKAARVEAINDGDNRFIIDTHNVVRLTVWLHPQMADLSKPIRIVLNGKESQHRVTPSLLAALRSFEKRPDWSSVFHAELQLDVSRDSAPPPVSQWRGPNRDGLIPGFKAPRKWPDKLSRQWSVPVGIGYSCPVTDGKRVFLHSRTDLEEVVHGIDLASGKVEWTDSYSAPAQVHPAGASHGLGPKSTPVVRDGRLYTLGIGSILSCYDVRSGQILWRKNYADEFPRPAPSCGTSMSPMIVDGMCIVHVGVDRKGRLIALDAKSGEERWSYDDDGPGYGSPVVATFNNRRQIISPVSKFIAGVSPSDGRLLWRHPFPTKSTQNILTPVVHRDRLIVGGIGQVTACLRPAESIESVWQNRDIPLHMSSPVLKGNRLYGMSSRNAGHLFCVDADTGKTIWQSDARVAQNAVVQHLGSHLAWLTGDGLLVFTRADADEYEPVATYRVSTNRTWAHPLPIGRRLVVKDEGSLTCWEIR